MPTYDYRCSACGHELEVFQSIREPALKKCPKCKKLKLERQIGAGAGILFKGGGFYQTDYRSESYKRDESSEKGGTEKTGATPAGAPDSSSPKDSDVPQDAGAAKPGGSERPATSAGKPKGSKPASPPKKTD